MHRILGYHRQRRILPSKFDQKKVPPETRSEAECGFGRALMPSCLGMLHPKELSDAADVSPFKEIGAALACPKGLQRWPPSDMTCLQTLGVMLGTHHKIIGLILGRFLPFRQS